MPNVVSYLCDQNIRMCRDYCRMGLSDCRHTFDPDHAKNGEIDPEKVYEYPDRFAYISSRIPSKGNGWFDMSEAPSSAAYRIDYYEEKVT